MTVSMIELRHLITSDRMTVFPKKTVRGFASIKNSIEKDGLLNPLIVVKQKGKYLVIDGKKRLLALRALAKSKLFRRALYKVPCIVDNTDQVNAEPDRPTLLSGPELAHKIISMVESGISPVTVAQRYECSMSVIEDSLALRRLHPEILLCFNNNTLSLEQAAAFATIDNISAQWSLLLQIGPFMSNTDIIAAIKAGAAVLDLPSGEVIILPSRTPKPRTPNFDSIQASHSQELLAA